MYIARITRIIENELAELLKTNYLNGGLPPSTQKPIRVIFTGNDKPVLFFYESNLEFALELFKQYDISTNLIPIRKDLSFSIFADLLEKGNIEALIN